MDLYPVDEQRHLFISPVIGDWQTLRDEGISVVIDLEGGLDLGVPTVPNQLVYVYFPIFDEEVPDLEKLHGVAELGARMLRGGEKVLVHCRMGFNRSALVAGRILVELGVPGREAVTRLRRSRPGALFNEVFASYLEGLPGSGGEP